jgi:ankyrin repeat protein
LDKGAKLDETDEDGRTALHIAARAGNKECVDLLLTRGADVSAQDRVAFYSPLHLAVYGGNKACVESLLNAGADVNIRNAVVEAYDREHTQTVRVTNRNITDENIVGIGRFPGVIEPNEVTLDYIHVKSVGITPLHAAAYKAYPEVAQVLIEHGAHVNAIGTNGATPLLIACAQVLAPTYITTETTLADFRQRAERTVRLLVERGADIDLGGSGRSPLYLAILYRNRDLVKLFLDHGANPNGTCDYDHDPKRPLLHLAVGSSSADIEIVKSLLDHGADVNAEGTYTGMLGLEKRTALRVAKNKEIKALLQEVLGRLESGKTGQ